MHRQLPLVSSRLRKPLPVSRSKDAKWVQQLSAGDSTAWLHLIEQWSPRLYTYLFYQGVSEADAQTLLAAIFAEIVQRVVGRVRVVNLTVLIFAIAGQHLLSHRRQRPVSSQKLPSPPTFAAAVNDAQQSAFLETFRHCPPEAQQVLLLYYLFELPLPEIAQIVGQPEGVLRQVLYQFKHKLP